MKDTENQILAILTIFLTFAIAVYVAITNQEAIKQIIIVL